MINFIFVFLTNVFFSAPSIFLVVVSAHFGSFNDAALLGASFSICAPVQLFFSMQHNVSILSGQLSFRDSLRTRFLLIVPFLLFGLFGSILFSSQIIFCFFLYRCAEFLYEPILCEGIRKGSCYKIFVSTLFRFVLFATIVFGMLYAGASLDDVLLVVGVVFSLLTLRYISFAFHGGEPSFNGFTLGAAAFLSSVIVNIPRYFVVGADPSFAGFYSNMLTLVLGGGLLYGAFNNYFFPRLIASGSNGAVKFLNISAGVFVGGVLVSYLLFSGVVIPKLFLSIFLGDKYLVYFELVIGFAFFYFVMYFHAALNFLFVFLGLAKFYMASLIAYGLCMASFIIVSMKFFSGDFSRLIWVVVGFGVVYAAICYTFLMVRFLKGYKA
ncbi:hypothetical protein D3C87_710950 [compost metagenome]